MNCPKCGNTMWVATMGESTWLKCICGKLVPIEICSNGVRRVYHSPVTEGNLPRKGSKLAVCLGIMVGRPTMDTALIAKKLKQTTSETASQLSVLQSKGFVDKENSRKGKIGGSMWALTAEAKQLYK